MRRGFPVFWGLFCCTLFFVPSAHAGDAEEAIDLAREGLRAVEGQLAEIQAVPGPRPTTPEQRLAAGELYLREHDYDRAVRAFSQVVELHRQGQVSAVVHADALFLLAEAYFRSEQLLSAHRHYLELVEHASTKEYAPHSGAALGRLVDVALRTGRHEQLGRVFEILDSLRGADTTGARTYARAKAHYALGQHEQAEAVVAGIAEGTKYYPQGRYLLGVLFIKGALRTPAVEPTKEQAESVPASARRFARAILEFQHVARLEVDSDEHRHVQDLAWLALGRTFYETDNPLDAVDAYLHVGRGSPEFENMLAELSWAYVQLEQFTEAQRVLQVLSVLQPERLDFAESALLKADLMLRAKQFGSALSVYEAVRSRFEPVRSRVEELLQADTEPAAYYDRLVDSRLGVNTSGALPAVLLQWMTGEEDNPVVAIIEDVTRARRLAIECDELIDKMTAVLEGDTRWQAVPLLRDRLQVAVGLQNQLLRIQQELGRGLDAAGSGTTSGQLAGLGARRRELEERVKWLPTLAADFASRNSSGMKPWFELSQKLQRLELEADKLQAVVNGLEEVLRQASRFNVPNRPGLRQRLESEIGANHADLKAYRAAIDVLRDQIERGRIQVGFGDARYQADETLRARFSAIWEQELKLVRSGAGGAERSEYVGEIQPMLTRVRQLQDWLAQVRNELETSLAAETGALLDLVLRERSEYAAFLRELDGLDHDARRIIGEATKNEFAKVGARLNDIVMRADVGITQQAWERRTDHLERLRALQRRRAKERRELAAELKEVLGVEAAVRE